MQKTGKVILIPTVLHEEALHTIPAYITDAIKECSVFFEKGILSRVEKKTDHICRRGLSSTRLNGQGSTSNFSTIAIDR